MTLSDRRQLSTASTRHFRYGLTLIEIMIAMTMTLIVLGAMMIAFQYASQQMKVGRAVIEMSNQLRSAQELIRSDLEGVTVDPRPWSQTADANGAFEYIEGVRRDDSDAADPLFNYLGDLDDALVFTARSNGRPFRGRYNGKILESTIAEIIWWTYHDDRNADMKVDYDESVTVYRRVLLVRPDLSADPDPNWLSVSNDPNFFQLNDISTRNSSGQLVANSLADLSLRQNRYCHGPVFPHPLMRNELVDRRKAALDPSGTLVFTGDDIVLTDTCGFDVRVYSPDSQIYQVANMVVEPGDPGFTAGGSDDGAFVDLGFNIDHLAGNPPTAGTPFDPNPWFGDWPTYKSGCYYPSANGNGRELVYDTWTPFYEHDGVAQYSSPADAGTNGLDDDGANGVDDNTERDTMPPYPAPLRGIKVSFRIVEKGTKQVRQTSVVHSFLPQ
jgi:type II secretory pathway pseudopilin PulG